MHLELDLIFHLVDVVFSTAQRSTALMLTNNSRFISDTIHSRARSEVTEVQMHEVDLLFECILIRDGQALCCPVGFLGQMYKRL